MKWLYFGDRLKVNWWGVILGAWLLFLVAPDVRTVLSNSPVYREMAGLTPFYDVKVERVEVAGLSVTVTGSLRIRECEKLGHAVYTRRAGEPWRVARFSTREDPETPRDRPSLNESRQAFGPWTITSVIPEPAEASMTATHRCNGQVQTNTVFVVSYHPEKGPHDVRQ